MYLKNVAEDIKNAKNLKSEDLFKLNEAVFNLLENETVDTKLAETIYGCARKCVEKGNRGADDNYMYDLRAMLGTLQNQHFFSLKQNLQLIQWLSSSQQGTAGQKPDKLSSENEKLKQRVADLEKLLGAVRTVITFGKTAQQPGQVQGGGKNKNQNQNQSKKGSKAGASKEGASRQGLSGGRSKKSSRGRPKGETATWKKKE